MSKKDALLKAAGVIVTTQGIQDLTLDAVAKHAEVSKGGLLYHFPTKEALIYGMMEHFVQEFDDSIAAEMNSGEKSEGQWLRAYVTVCTTPYEEVDALSTVLFAFSTGNPQFSAPILEAYERWRQQAEADGVPPDVARLVCMAADGGWLYSLHHPSTDEQAKTYLLTLRKQLLSLIDEGLKASVR